LAKNEKVQEKLREEIKELAGNSELIPFDVLDEMPYLDQVVYGKFGGDF
jgi:hypothetical protein